MKILHITNMYPYKKKPWYGIFVYNQIESLKRNSKYKIDCYFINGADGKLNYLKSIIELRKFKNSYDIIHCHHGWCAIIAALVFKKETKIVSLVGGDLLEKDIWYKKILVNVTKRVIRKFNHVIVKSENMKRELVNLDLKKISVIPNGVNLDLFKPMAQEICKNEIGIDLKKQYFLFTAAENGQGRPEKRFDIIDSALKIINDDDIKVLCMNNINHRDVPKYINSCEAVLMCSDYEGSPNIIKEAMACNVHIISTDVGNVAEMISGVQSSIIIRQDSKEFALAIKNIANGKLNNNGISGRQKLKDMELDEDSIARKILNIYKTFGVKL
ncbi:glycosyltransferase [Clostridium paraputrificum]|uniref:glycosyltransferase n=1 Tax=Clostridium paraputrificum TaxID=29363 RepID=UPI0035634782